MDPNEKTKSQQETEEALAAGQEQSDEAQEGFYRREEKSDSGSKTAGIAAKVAGKTTPAGVALSFLARNKKGAFTGGTILTAIISITIFISTIIGGTKLVWMGSIFNDFNFGPHNRNAVTQSLRIRDLIRNGAFTNSDTPTARQAEQVRSDPDRMARADSYRGDTLGNANQRSKYRANISNKINTARPSDYPRFRWQFFTGHSADSPNFQSGKRRMRGTDSMRTSSRGGGHYQQEVDEIRNSDNPERTRMSSARRIVGGSLTGAGLAVACFSVMADDFVPDPKERYEILMSRAADFQTASSQQAAGEQVHGDEVADKLSAYTERVEVLATDEDIEFGDESGIGHTEDEDSGNTYLDEDDLERRAENDPINAETKTVTRTHSDAAAWKRHTNQEVSGNEPDIDFRFEAEDTLLARSILFIGGGLGSIPGSNTACSVLTNPYVSWGLGAVEGIASLLTGPGAFGRFAVLEGLVFTIGYMLANIAFNGLVPEGAEELYGQIDMGGNIANSENSRIQGAPPSSSSEMNQQRTQNYSQLAQEDRERGFVWRYLSPENHRSVVARTALSAQPLGLRTILRPFIDFTGTIGSTLSNIFSPTRADEDFHNYEIEQFAFSDAVFDRVGDPVQNDIEMEKTQSYQCSLVDGGQSLVDNVGDDCDVDRWNDAMLMEVIEDDCMDRPYYEHMDEDWTYEYVQVEVEQDEDGNYEIDEDEFEIDCREPTSSERELWEKVGVWRFHKDIVDNIECLSHSGPCGSASTDRGGSSHPELPSGSPQDLAQQILDNDDIGVDATPRSQLESVVDGDTDVLDRRILSIIVALGENNEFTITSMRRSGPCQTGTSRHNCGLAVDFSGTRGINGTTFTYSGHSQDVQDLVNDAANIIGTGCEIGLPNQEYVNQTRPIAPEGCNVFIDRGSGAHVHLAVSRR